MRPFLLDFLIEVHAQFRLRPETLYLALNLVDRYVSKRVVYKKHYQLVGCAALWTAAKFEDQKDRVPLVKELSEMCCKAYDESAFIQMEGHVLGTVNWNLGAPSAEAWLRLFNKEANEDRRTQDIARFVMEMTLYYRDFVGMPAYDIATAAMILARFIDGKHRRVSSTPSDRSSRADGLDRSAPGTKEPLWPPFARSSNANGQDARHLVQGLEEERFRRLVPQVPGPCILAGLGPRTRLVQSRQLLRSSPSRNDLLRWTHRHWLRKPTMVQHVVVPIRRPVLFIIRER